MKTFIFILAFLATFHTGQTCRAHQPPYVPQSFIGTVGQGCTPKTITAVTQLITDPLKCDLPLGGVGCNLCGLRLYKPEKTTSRFLVQPLYSDFSVTHTDHVEATECKCSEGCYFHKASITQLGIEPLPTGITGVVGSFSEPFACYSGISMPSVASPPAYTFLIWCETDGGCPNAVVSRYLYYIRFEILSPNRPATTSTFIPKITTLPPSKCLINELPPEIKDFISGRGAGTIPPTTVPRKGECEKYSKNKNCESKICVSRRCVKSRKQRDVAWCFPTPSPTPGPNGSCNSAKRIASFVSACLANP